MPDETAAPTPSPPGPTPAGFQRTTGGKGFRWEPPTPERLAELLPQYEIECMLGRGGMGAVYKGKQKSLERTVAIKILPPGLEEDPSYIERFKNEAKVMAKFMHPAIVGVFDFGETAEGQLYIVMEYVDGTDVQKLISSQGKLPPEHALAITAHVCDALKYAHEHGVIHRDIKPANILINHEGAVKVADFGLAKAEEAGSSGLTKTGMAMGTPDYVAPEALMLGTEVDGRADLYAVGVMLYQMLTGQIPRGAWQAASVLTPGTDRRFDQIITKAMQYDREARYQSSGEIRRDLDAILTAPLVQSGGPGSAAIPQQSLPQKPVGKPPQAKNTSAPPAQKSAAKQPSQQEATPPAKFKTPLFIGIGAAAALGIGAFVMLGGKKDTAKAKGPPTAPASSSKPALAAASPPPSAVPPKTNQPAPVKSSEEPKTAAVSAPRLPVSRTSLSASSEPWQNVLLDPKTLSLTGNKPEITAEGLRFSGSGIVKYLTPTRALQRDGAVRMLATLGKHNPSLHARNNDSQNGSYRLWADQGRVVLARYVPEARKMITLQEFPLRKSLQLGENYELELRAVGKTITAKYNGELLGNVTDETHASGHFGLLLSTIDSTPVLVLAMEVLDLDAPPEPAPIVSAPAPTIPKTATTAPSREWQPVEWRTVDRAKLAEAIEGGWHHLNDQLRGATEQPQPEGKQMTYRAFRCQIRTTEKGAGLKLGLGQSPFYIGTHYSTKAIVRHTGGGGKSETTLAELDLTPPVTAGTEVSLELATYGKLLVARFDGKLIGLVRDERISPQNVIYLQSYSGEDGWFKDAQYRDLSGLSEAEALKLLGVDEKGNDLRAASLAAEQKAMEQAKEVYAANAIPELKALHDQLVKLTTERVTAPFETDVAKLNAGYFGGIDRKIAEETAAGHLDGVIALEAEKKLLADKLPIPANDAETTTATLKALRGIYRAAYAKIEAARVANLKQLTDPLSARLQALESELTKQKRIPDAKTVREYREKLAEGNAATTANNANPGGGAAKTPEAGKSASAPLPEASTKYPKGDDRKAAEWVISMGGKVTVFTNGTSTEVSTAADLPPGKFSVQKVLLDPPNQPVTDLLPLAGLKELTQVQLSHISSLDDADMEVFTSLSALEKLLFDFGSLTDAALSNFAKLRNLKVLSLREQKGMTGEALPLLAKLNLTDLNLQGCKFTDAGFKSLGLLTQLARLGLQQTNFNDGHLVSLEPLKKLDDLNLGDCGVTIDGLARSKGMPNLTKLGLRLQSGGGVNQYRELATKFPKVFRIKHYGDSKTTITPQDIAAIASFPKLTECSLTEASDTALPGLLELPNLSFIGIGYSPTTDAGLAALLPHKGLRSLEIQNNTRKVEITDAGLLRLAEMKKLTSVKINSNNITDAGIAALKKLRPDMTVTR